MALEQLDQGLEGGGGGRLVDVEGHPEGLQLGLPLGLGGEEVPKGSQVVRAALGAASPGIGGVMVASWRHTRHYVILFA